MTTKQAIQKLRKAFPDARFISISTDYVDYADKERLQNRENVRIQVSDNLEHETYHYASESNLENAVAKILNEHKQCGK